VIEGWRLGLGVGVDEDELVSAWDGLAIPESVRVSNPLNLFWRIDREALVTIAHRDRARVIRDGALRVSQLRVNQQSNEERSRDQQAGIHS
jgi:hypothetical protein